MTALNEYDRLETTGLWRESPQAQRRDVHVSFGEASLIIRDRNDTALTHWSLSAVSRGNPGQRPALFHPGDDSGEELELEDQTMIAAIEKVRHAVDRKRPRSGRLRALVTLAIVAGIAALGAFWLPDALTRHTVAVVPETKRVAIGRGLLGHVSRLSGRTCQSTLGTPALARLKARVLGDQMRRAYVLQGMARNSATLPGGFILLAHRVVEDYESPEVAAGFLLNATATAATQDPLALLLEDAGLKVTFQLLTTGEIADAALANYAQTLLAAPDPLPDTVTLIGRFEAAKVPTTPFAYAIDITGETVINLIEADPMRGTSAPRLLSDGDWLSLQEICRET